MWLFEFLRWWVWLFEFLRWWVRYRGAWCTFWEGQWWIMCLVGYLEGLAAAVYPLELWELGIFLGRGDTMYRTRTCNPPWSILHVLEGQEAAPFLGGHVHAPRPSVDLERPLKNLSYVCVGFRIQSLKSNLLPARSRGVPMVAPLYSTTGPTSKQ